jgi:hypothetical protein
MGLQITTYRNESNPRTADNGSNHQHPDSTIPRKGRPYAYAGGRLTREVLRSHAKPVGALKRVPKEASMRRSYVRALKVAGLLGSSDGAFSKWMHRFGERDIGLYIDEQLGLEEGTYE